MDVFLSVCGVLLWLGAFVAFAVAKSSVQEIEGCVIGVSGSVLIAGACIVSAVKELWPKRIAAQAALEAAEKIAVPHDAVG